MNYEEHIEKAPWSGTFDIERRTYHYLKFTKHAERWARKIEKVMGKVNDSEWEENVPQTLIICLAEMTVISRKYWRLLITVTSDVTSAKVIDGMRESVNFNSFFRRFKKL
jgi:hypothetical protein